MSKKMVLLLIACFFMAILVTESATAGYLVFRNGDLPLISKKIDIKIKNQVAVTNLELVFDNPHDFTIQPNIKFPVHETASVQNFSLTDSQGKTYAGTIQEKEEAQKTFDNAKEDGIMPAIAVKKQPGVFEASIGAIGPKSRATVNIEYSEILPYQKGNINYQLPFNIKGWQRKPLEEVAINVSIEDQKDIATVLSPSHNIYANKVSANNWSVSFEKNNFLPEKDFNLTYEVKADKMATNFLSTRPAPEKDGFFVLLLSPQEVVDKEDIAKRDIVFIMDVSGSMRGNKINQTKKAFNYFVDKLNENDRFSIISFSDRAYKWKKELQTVTESSVNEAKDFINSLNPQGGTNINESLLSSLEIIGNSKDRTKAIVFLTDGSASAGETRKNKILENFKLANELGIRTFCLGVGRGVNTKLLSKLAQENRGEAVYLNSHASIEKDLKSFYESISTPLLVDLKLDYGNMKVSECFPKTLPNIYKGTQLVITGRYSDIGEGNLNLKGNLNGKEVSFPIRTSFAASSTQNLFVSRYWAQAKANQLMADMKAIGEKQELKDEVIRLSKEYQFATPYTSFVAVSAEVVPQIKKPNLNNRISSTKSSHKLPALVFPGNNRKTVKKVVVRKRKAKKLSLWGANGFLPLAAVMVPNFRRARCQARGKACHSNMRVLLGAIEMYNMDHEEMITHVSPQIEKILVQEGYLKSPLTKPESGCHYGTTGDLTKDGEICCALHGIVGSSGKGNSTGIFFDDNGNAIDATQIEFRDEPVTWKSRMWEKFVVPFLNLAINIPLFLLGIYVTVILPLKLVGRFFGFIFGSVEE